MAVLNDQVPRGLEDGLSEGLLCALMGTPFEIDNVLDEYLRSLDMKSAEIWQNAHELAQVLVRTIIPAHHFASALEQTLVHRVRDRLHSLDR